MSLDDVRFRRFMTKRRRNIITVLEEVDFLWDESELQELQRLHKEGKTIREMNEVFQREDPDEIFLALFHLAKEGTIKKLDVRRLLA